MSKFIYNLRTGTYFPIDDAIVVIDLHKHRTKINLVKLDDEMKHRGQEIAVECGEPLTDLIKEDNN